MMKSKAWVAGLAGLFLGGSSAALAQNAPTLDTPFGPVVGQMTDGVEAFLGIPFAAPPVGALRWRPPEDPEPWGVPRPAVEMASECVQMGSVTDPQTGEETTQAVGSEDCLYLNLWRPAGRAAEPRPIMVWIHGGANVAGSAAEPRYDGAALAASQDAIVISIQYRLNVSGYFLYDSVLGSGPVAGSGNFGTLDQIQALSWVQAAAQAAGGDAERVMIFGESAGAYNVWTLMMSPLARGGFHSAAIQSGCPSWVGRDDAIDQGQRIAEIMVVADGLATEENAAEFLVSQGDAWVEAYLRAQDAKAMLETLNEASLLSFNFGAIADGAVVYADPNVRLASGDYTLVPTIIGANRDESKALYNSLYPIGPVAYRTLTDLLFGEWKADVEAVYPRRDYLGRDYLYERLVDMSDGAFEVVCTTQAALDASRHHPVWLYRFDYDDLAPPADVAMGAGHTYEIYFVFGTQDDAIYAADSAADRRDLTAEMMNAWGCLARTGDPSACPAAIHWPQLSNTAPRRVIFDAPSTVQPIPTDEFEKIDFWLSYPPDGAGRQLEAVTLGLP